MGIFSGEAEFRGNTCEVIHGVLLRHRIGQLTGTRGRVALAAFVSSLAPEGFLTAEDLAALDLYLDVTLAFSKSGDAGDAAIVDERVTIIGRLTDGDTEARMRLSAP